MHVGINCVWLVTHVNYCSFIPCINLKIHTFDDILKLLNTLIFSTVDGKVNISKDTLCDIQTCLHNAREKIEFWQLESQFQWDDLENNPLFKIETDSREQQEYEVDSLPSSRADLHAGAEIQPALPNSAIRP